MNDSGEIRRADHIGKTDKGRQLKPSQIAMLALLGIVVLFALLNLDEAKIDLLFTSLRMPVVFVIAVSALIGFGVGYLLARHLADKD
jgi:uncharacterized integral membrane protein